MKQLLTIVLSMGFILSTQQNSVAEQVPATVSAWLNFDASKAKLPDSRNCIVTRDTRAARGSGCLLVALPPKMTRKARLTFKLPSNFSIKKMRALQCYLRTTPEAKPVKMRWSGEDAKGNIIFQRRFEFDQGAVWTLFEFPLKLWRWGSLCGDWADVRTLSLSIESVVSEVRIDDLRWANGFSGKDNATATPELYEQIAFGERKYHTVERGGFRVTGDTLKEVEPKDIDRLFSRFEPIPKWLTRIFGSTIQVSAADSPISILVFANRTDYVAFIERLGTAWRVSIAPPEAGGYAIQNVATSFIDEKLGVDRPVFFHETVHATVAHYLHLIPGNASHSWLQEGLANYLQLCLFPDSLELKTYERLFKGGIGDKTFFRPLEDIMTGSIGLNNYAQLAALTAWLVDKHSDWLVEITDALASGGTVPEALKQCKTSFGAMQREWLAWGLEKFKPNTKRDHHFKLPTEWEK